MCARPTYPTFLRLLLILPAAFISSSGQHHVWNKRVKQFPDVVFLCLRAQFLRDSRLLWRDVGQKKWNSSTAKEGTTAWSATIRPRQNHWGCSFTALLRKQRESFGTGTSCLEHYLKQCGPHSEIKDCQREKKLQLAREKERERERERDSLC